MKKVAVILLLLTALIVSVCLFAKPREETAYLRIHIRADSNEAVAQEVKYKVRDAVVEYLTPTVAMCKTKEEAKTALSKMLGGIEKKAETVLKENGFDYGARASLKKEEFPTRIYDGVTLEAGVYDALIVELGSGKGDNWWCVVYPPLCFSGTSNVTYRSLIAELIRKFYE